MPKMVKDAAAVIADFSNVVYGPARNEDYSTLGAMQTWYRSVAKSYGTITAQTLVRTMRRGVWGTNDVR
jgi:hypothetical protein